MIDENPSFFLSGLEICEIKYHLWVRNRDFQPSILQFKTQVSLLSSLPAKCSSSQLLLRSRNLILVCLYQSAIANY